MRNDPGAKLDACSESSADRARVAGSWSAWSCVKAGAHVSRPASDGRRTVVLQA